MSVLEPTRSADLESKAAAARERLDAHTYETVQWHFHPSTGCPFWLEHAASLKFDPLQEIRSYADLRKFEPFQDEWLRGGPVRRWVPQALADKPIYVFETGGTTGTPKSRVAADDFRTDYELFSETLPDEHFPRGSNWLMLGPSGPRRLRLAVEHLCQFRGGICFCIDLDPRWVIKLIKKGWMEHLEAYKDHVIDQAVSGGADRATVEDQFFLKDELRTLVTLNLRRQWLYQTLTTSVFVYYSPSDADSYTRLVASYALSDEVTLTLGANLFTADDPRTLFGMNDLNDNIYGRIRYGF